MKLTKGQVVQVRWLDAAHEGGWVHEGKLKDLPAKMLSAGHFLKFNDKGLYLFMDLPDKDKGLGKQIGSVQFIPEGCVLGVRRVEKWGSWTVRKKRRGQRG